MAMALTQGPRSFYALRFLLGVAEAGFVPGLLYYLTLWYPPQQRAQAIVASLECFRNFGGFAVE